MYVYYWTRQCVGYLNLYTHTHTHTHTFKVFYWKSRFSLHLHEPYEAPLWSLCTRSRMAPGPSFCRMLRKEERERERERERGYYVRDVVWHLHHDPVEYWEREREREREKLKFPAGSHTEPTPCFYWILWQAKRAKDTRERGGGESERE